MIRFHKRIAGPALIAAGLILALLSAHAAVLDLETVIYRFTAGSDGSAPYGRLITDSSGNFYGTTAGGGGGTGCGSSQGCGTVFQLTPDGHETVLYAFDGGQDGTYPRKGLLLDGQGNLYGTTGDGGNSGLGTAFKLSAAGVKTTLHHFTGGTDGGNPNSELVADAAGNLYGTTRIGGSTGHGGPCLTGCGTVYRITPEGVESVLYAFRGSEFRDGSSPSGGLLVDAEGNLIGATFNGGSRNCGGVGCGTIFRLTPEGQETILYTFLGGTDGLAPNGNLIRDAGNNLYGTTLTGGVRDNRGGTVFQLTPDGVLTVLHRFHSGNDGLTPEDGVIMDSAGNLYGTTASGGAHKDGTVFQVTPDHQATILHAFAGGTDGRDTRAGLVMDSTGSLWGTTILGGTMEHGVIFKVDLEVDVP